MFHSDPPIPEPTFVYMDHIPESADSAEGDDDKVYLFFSENAMEYDFYSKLTVSRVARVCKVHQHTHTLLRSEVFTWTCITVVQFI